MSRYAVGAPTAYRLAWARGEFSPVTTAPVIAAGARTADVAIATTCSGIVHRTVEGKLDRYIYRGEKFIRGPSVTAWRAHCCPATSATARP